MKKLMVIILLILAVLFFAVTGSIPLHAPPDAIARKVATMKLLFATEVTEDTEVFLISSSPGDNLLS